MSASHSMRRMVEAQPVTKGGAGRRRKKGQPKLTMAERDAQYRRALGLGPDSKDRLPSAIGQQASAGGARGGRGAANKGKGRNS